MATLFVVIGKGTIFLCEQLTNEQAKNDKKLNLHGDEYTQARDSFTRN